MDSCGPVYDDWDAPPALAAALFAVRLRGGLADFTRAQRDTTHAFETCLRGSAAFHNPGTLDYRDLAYGG